MNTILITGCSSGFGLEIAREFLAKGWQVIATMRSPNSDVLPAHPHLRILPLDVRSADSIAAVVEQAGDIDVLVNNAGIGFLNALEGTPMEVVRDIFETNTFGTMAMCQAFMPMFRARKAGTIINVTSTVTLHSLPLLSVYTASKAAVNAFTESFALELAPFNIKAHLVLPGRAPETRFGDNARARMTAGFPEPYMAQVESIFAQWEKEPVEMITQAQQVAQAVWRSATDPACPARLPAGTDATATAERVGYC